MKERNALYETITSAALKASFTAKELIALRRFGLPHRHNADAGGAVHRQPVRGGAGEVDDSASRVGSAVVDRHQDRLAIREIGDFRSGPEGQTPMGGGKGVLVEAFATRGLFTVKPRSVPGCRTHLVASRACFERDSGERQGGRQYDGREPCELPEGPARAGAWRSLRSFTREPLWLGRRDPRSSSGGRECPELGKRHDRSLPHFFRHLSSLALEISGYFSISN